MTSSNGNIFRVTGPLCGEFTGPGEFPTQRPVTRRFDVFFYLRLNKRLSKQPWGWWFETPSWSLWRHRNVHPTQYNECDYLPMPNLSQTMLVKGAPWKEINLLRVTINLNTTLDAGPHVSFIFIELVFADTALPQDGDNLCNRAMDLYAIFLVQVMQKCIPATLFFCSITQKSDCSQFRNNTGDLPIVECT